MQSMNRALRISAMTALIAGLAPVPAHGESGDVSATTPPTLTQPDVDTGDCYPIGSTIRQREAEVTVMLTIAADGTVADTELPAGSPPWMATAVDCVVGKLKIQPATHDGVAVEAKATLPIAFAISRREGQTPPETSMPALRSDEAELEAAYRKCYSAGRAGEAAVIYRFTIGVDGRARGIAVVNGSDNRKIDKAGACVLEKLRFTPAVRGNEALESTVTWSVLVRPPRSADQVASGA